MSTANQGNGTATPPGDGAAGNQPSTTEVTELTAKLAASETLVSTRDAEIVTRDESITALTEANTRFAADAEGVVAVKQQLTESQAALEESRKTTTKLTEELETSNTRNTNLSGDMLTRRRSDLISRYSLTEEHVAGMDATQLDALERTLPHAVPGSQTNPSPAPQVTGNGHGMGSGSQVTDVSAMSDKDRSLKLIERLKEPK